MAQLWIIVALIALVIVHELGHFIAARLVGVRATKFYVFFPPAAAKKQIGDVEYGIGLLPLGGFVKLPGMFEPVPDEVAKRVGWELDAIDLGTNADRELTLDAAQRRIERSDHPDELVAPLTEIHETLVARQGELQTAAPADAKRIAKSIDRVQGMLDDCHPKAYWRADLWRRMTVIFAGPFVNLVVAFVLLFAFYAWFQPVQQTSGPLRIGAVAAASPAAKAGIDDKARISKWNGSLSGLTVHEFNQRITDSIGKPVTLTWKNPGDPSYQTKTIEPAIIDKGDDAKPRIGIAIAGSGGNIGIDTKVVGREGTNPSDAAASSFRVMRELTWGNLKGIAQLTYDKQVRKDVGGVVGIVDVSDQVHQAGLTLYYVGVISLVLAVMNLLPLLPLDGGHILFGIIEFFRRKPLPRMAFERYSMVGLALVLVLFFVGLNNDIGRITG